MYFGNKKRRVGDLRGGFNAASKMEVFNDDRGPSPNQVRSVIYKSVSDGNYFFIHIANGNLVRRSS